MTEADIYSGFTIQALPGGERIAVFRLIIPDGMISTEEEESVFDAPSLEIRVRNLRRQGLDASMSEAALQALRADRARSAGRAGAASLAAFMGAAATAPYPATLAGLPGRSDLLRAIANAMAMARDRLVHGPCVVRLGIPELAGIARRGGPEAEAAVLIGVADRLAENVRRVDTLAYLGQATFGACLPRVPRTEAMAITERLRRSVTGTPVEAPGGPVAVTLDVEVLEVSPGGTRSVPETAAALLATLHPPGGAAGAAAVHAAPG